jgi:hypothetical protein
LTKFLYSQTTAISNTGTIQRGFKQAYGLRQVAGLGINAGGNGGEGATGGTGGSNRCGGGGGSGYSDGSIKIVTTQQGGNTGDAKVVIRLAATPTLAPPPPPPPVYYDDPGPAPEPVYGGFAGGVSQNVGGSQSQIYGGSTQPVIGQGGFDRAIADGFSVSSIQAWINATGASVGGALAGTGLQPPPGRSYS